MPLFLNERSFKNKEKCIAKRPGWLPTLNSYLPTTMPPVSGTESRWEAWRILREQETDGVFLKDLFAQRLGRLPANDADLVRAICLGVVRRRRLLDYNLDAHAPRGIK